MKVFLGGTCGDSKWRDELIPLLEAEDIDYFNPVVEDWTPECQEAEEWQKGIECDVHLYIITSEMQGVFSIAEAVNSAHTEGKRCLFMINPDGFSESQLKSLIAVKNLISRAGGDVKIGLYSDWLSWVPTILNLEEAPVEEKRHVVKAWEKLPAQTRKHIQILNAPEEKGVAPIVKFTIQSDPISEVGINGCQVVDIIEYARNLIGSLNEVFQCRENAITITKLEEALMWQNARTADRAKRNVEGFMKE